MSETLEWRPASLVRVRVIRPKFATKGKPEVEGWGVRMVAEVISVGSSPPSARRACGAGLRGCAGLSCHWHNLPRPEEPLRGVKGCGANVA
ncbi:hypothetical protein [Polyangium sp. y55x31]|uniref:hypothetical protein n=1 Tax=Polyangium sp. y55x31 TaxID=3042688 RepID=UPI0032B2203E